jgi:DNA-binding NarL/FixJ family response regulator
MPSNTRGGQLSRRSDMPESTAGTTDLTIMPRQIRRSGGRREIAGPDAEGLMNRDIAERLVVSKRTVDAHVEHVRAPCERDPM